MSFVALFISSLVLTIIAVPVMRLLAVSWHLERKNFKGKTIPAGFGFLLVLVAVPLYGLLLVLHVGGHIWAFLFAVLGFGAVGLIDDIYGTREAGGFRGHIGLLKKGKVSTGLLKAVVGGMLGLILGFVAAGFDPVQGFLNGFLISLCANTLNLLDLRPGRAVSCFWVGILALFFARTGRLSEWQSLLPILTPAVLLTVQDRSARVMLGDAGSNALGAVLGLALVYEIGFPMKVAVLLVMVIVHLYAEKYSISKLIESNRILRYVDRLLGER